MGLAGAPDRRHDGPHERRPLLMLPGMEESTIDSWSSQVTPLDAAHKPPRQHDIGAFQHGGAERQRSGLGSLGSSGRRFCAVAFLGVTMAVTMTTTTLIEDGSNTCQASGPAGVSDGVMTPPTGIGNLVEC